MTERLSLRELARRLDRDKAGLSRLATRGVIPKGSDGKFDEAEVRAALGANVDPAREKTVSARQRSTPLQSTVNAPATTGAVPMPSAYRDRPDLPDDGFIRGAIWAAHAMAFGLPVVVGCAAQQVGVVPADAVRAYEASRFDAELLVAGICEDLGLLPPNADDAGPYSPTAFQGFDPNLPI